MTSSEHSYHSSEKFKITFNCLAASPLVCYALTIFSFTLTCDIVLQSHPPVWKHIHVLGPCAPLKLVRASGDSNAEVLRQQHLRALAVLEACIHLHDCFNHSPLNCDCKWQNFFSHRSLVLKSTPPPHTVTELSWITQEVSLPKVSWLVTCIPSAV